LASAQLDAFERVSALNLEAVKAAFEDGVSYTRSVTGAKDLQELFTLSTAAAQPAIDKAIAYGRNVYEVSNRASKEITRALEAQANEMTKNANAMFEQFAKSGPAGSDAAVAAVKSAIAAANMVAILKWRNLMSTVLANQSQDRPEEAGMHSLPSRPPDEAARQLREWRRSTHRRNR